MLQTNKLFLTCILTFSCVSLANLDKPIFPIDQNNWNELNKILIKSPEIQAETFTNKAIKVFGALAFGTVFWGWLGKYINAISPTKSNYTPLGDLLIEKGLFISKKRLFLAALPSLYVMRHAYRKMNEWVIAREEQKALKKFIENGEINQRATPTKLDNLLNDTYSKYKENPSSVDFAETARIVKTFINNQK